MWTLRSWVAGVGEATGAWRWPVALGVGAAIALWVVWYFTEVPCTIENARKGRCNAGIIAKFINYKILAQCILLGLAVVAVKGGYDEIMVSRERKRADAAEQRADEAEARLRAERERVDAMIEEYRAEQAEYRAEQAENRAEQAENRVERAENRAERQAMLNTLTQISATLTQLLAQQQNGRQSPEN